MLLEEFGYSYYEKVNVVLIHWVAGWSNLFNVTSHPNMNIVIKF